VTVLADEENHTANGLPIPAQWQGLVGPAIPCWNGLDILEAQWERTAPLHDSELGSTAFHEYLFWRRLSVVWTCTTIEAFLNEEGVAWVGERFFKENLERRSMRQKVELIYALKYGVRLGDWGDKLRYVSRLFQVRNDIVHPKAREIQPDGSERTQARNGIEGMSFRNLREAVWSITSLFEPRGVGETDEGDETTNNEIHGTQ
jgi:hypothetical protein